MVAHLGARARWVGRAVPGEPQPLECERLHRCHVSFPMFLSQCAAVFSRGPRGICSAAIQATCSRRRKEAGRLSRDGEEHEQVASTHYARRTLVPITPPPYVGGYQKGLGGWKPRHPCLSFPRHRLAAGVQLLHGHHGAGELRIAQAPDELLVAGDLQQAGAFAFLVGAVAAGHDVAVG